MSPIIEIRGLSLAYERDGRRTEILSALDLAVPRGQFLVIVGESGVGKSTLLRVLIDLAKPSTGTVGLHTAPDTRTPMALVFQDARLLPWRRVIDNVAFGLERHGLPKAERRDRAAAMLKLVGLADLAGRWPHQLSGGQRQRVAIARALAVEPEVLLMDEPFSALDSFTREGLQDEIQRIKAQTGKTVLFVTHDIDEAVYLADRVVVLAGSPDGSPPTSRSPCPVRVGAGTRSWSRRPATCARSCRGALRTCDARDAERERRCAGSLLARTTSRNTLTVALRAGNHRAVLRGAAGRIGMGIFQDALVRLNRVVMSYAGDAVFMQAAVSAAANVIVADGDTDEEEIEAALVSMRANPILEKSYDTLTLEKALFEALARAELRAGRLENLQQVAAVADRPVEHRQYIFLIAADAADKGGITESEHKVLDELAAALAVDKASLLA